MISECCRGPNDLNIILEIVTIVVASILMLLILVLSGLTFDILCLVTLVVSCVIGIVAVKRPESYRFGWVAAILAVFTTIIFAIFTILFLIALSFTIQAINDKGQENKGLLIFLVIVYFAYMAFGIGTSVSIAIKHFKIVKARQQDQL